MILGRYADAHDDDVELDDGCDDVACYGERWYRPRRVPQDDHRFVNCDLMASYHDVKWLLENPGSPQRFRPASQCELGMFGIPPGTVVVVQRAVEGVRICEFMIPACDLDAATGQHDSNVGGRPSEPGGSGGRREG